MLQTITINKTDIVDNTFKHINAYYITFKFNWNHQSQPRIKLVNIVVLSLTKIMIKTITNIIV